MTTNTPVIPKATYILALCQALNLTAAIISVTVAPLMGAKLAAHASWATVPYGCQFLAVMTCTYPAAMFMKRFGRKAGFSIGAGLLMLAGLLGYEAVARGSFQGLILAHTLLGGYVAFANFYRFAAVDNLGSAVKARAVSVVVSGGVVAALVGPLISVGLAHVGAYVPFSLCYASFCVLSVLSVVLLLLWKPNARTAECTAPQQAGQTDGCRCSPLIFVAVMASSVGYFLMNLLMVQASLMMKAMHVSFVSSSFAIQGHVIAMFAPSLATAAIIARLGYRNTLLGGFCLLAASCLLGALCSGFGALALALLMLGLGWNFSYVGGGALLSRQLSHENCHQIQGLNDFSIAVAATLGAFAPSLLQSRIGWVNTNMLCLALCAGCLALTWLCFRVNNTPARA